MKTKVLKPVLQMIAGLFAIGLAVATESTAINNPAFYDDPNVPGIQQVLGGVDCPTMGVISCKFKGFDLYADEGLSTPLYIRQK